MDDRMLMELLALGIDAKMSVSLGFVMDHGLFEHPALIIMVNNGELTINTWMDV